ncbi:hypothetical protein DFH06DRAFT_356072 [Mycena polygramma]|nr:hypothetical protein DFH06DRAFT_356072 [Mycena polygramma]
MDRLRLRVPTLSGSATQAENPLLADSNEDKETPVHSASTSLQASQEAHQGSWQLYSSGGLRALSFVMHSALIAIHLALLGIYTKKLEHRVIFSLDRQKTVSFAITAITTGFGTIYLGLMVFVTQTISTRRIIQTDQTLTAIHDRTAAWAGIGSAVFHLFHQTAVRGSLVGVFSVFFYLFAALLLHVTTPALFTIQTFNATRLVVVGTQSLPEWNATWENFTDPFSDSDPFALPQFTSGSLQTLPSVLMGGNKSLGLSGATLYDVLEKNSGAGSATVNATGFNISCKYPANSNITYDGDFGYYIADVEVLPELLYWQSTQWGVISALDQTGDSGKTRSGSAGLEMSNLCDTCTGLPGPLIMFSTIPIVDSNNQQAAMLNISSGAVYNASGPDQTRHPPTDLGVSEVQILVCSQTLVSQTAVVDAQSNELLTVEPGIQKTTSYWQPYTDLDIEIDNTTTGNMFLDGWAQWYLSMPPSNFPFSPYNLTADIPFVSVGAMYLIQRLKTHPGIDGDIIAGTAGPTFPQGFPQLTNVTLHDLENALATLVASMFWALGHNPPSFGGISTDTSLPYSNIDGTLPPPPMLRGNGTVTEILTKGRLDLSIIAIVGGLGASILLALLAIPSLLPQKGTEKDIPIDGTGILHAIWLYRNHPALDTLLPQVEHPSTNSLRAAGMVRTKLL